MKKGFTLSEVLITLVIIGVVAAITVPNINANARKEQYRASLFKMFSAIQQANLRFYNNNGYNPQCGYWLKNPYTGANNGAKCVERDEKGNCKRWELKDGSPLPNDYNGFFDDCTTLWRSYYKTLNVQKVCTKNAYNNGCIPKYKGRENLYADKNPDASDYDVQVAVSSSGFSQAAILSGSAIVLIDGTIIFTYMQESARYYAIDVNGQKGPNKWGTDVYAITPRMKNALGSLILTFDDGLMDKGGIKSKDILYRQ